VVGERLIELQTLEAGETLENIEKLLEVGPMVVGYMGKGKVYEVRVKERRRPQHATVVQRQVLQTRRPSAEQGPLHEIDGNGRVGIRYGEFLQQGGSLRFEENGHARQDRVGAGHDQALRTVNLGKQQAGRSNVTRLLHTTGII